MQKLLKCEKQLHRARRFSIAACLGSVLPWLLLVATARSEETPVAKVADLRILVALSESQVRTGDVFYAQITMENIVDHDVLVSPGHEFAIVEARGDAKHILYSNVTCLGGGEALQVLKPIETTVSFFGLDVFGQGVYGYVGEPIVDLDPFDQGLAGSEIRVEFRCSPVARSVRPNDVDYRDYILEVHKTIRLKEPLIGRTEFYRSLRKHQEYV